MASVVYSLIWFIVVVLTIVFIHECGHFLVARYCGVRVEVFSIGFGPSILCYNDSRGTQWRLSVIPLGGYVKMYGDYGPASIPNFSLMSKLTDIEKSQLFALKPVSQRMAIVAAGPIANYILAVVLFIIVFIINGIPKPNTEIYAVGKNSLAQYAGLQPGDCILSVNGIPVSTPSEIKHIMHYIAEGELVMEVLRNGSIYETRLPVTNAPSDIFTSATNKKELGIIFSLRIVPSSFIECIQASLKQTYVMSLIILESIVDMVLHHGTENVGGPIKIAQYSAEAAQKGGTQLISLIAVISLNLGIVNLLPIPMLDGGHLFFYCIEAIFGKPINNTVQMIAFRIGFILLMIIMFIAIFNDIKGLSALW